MKNYFYILGLGFILCACSTPDVTPKDESSGTVSHGQFHFIDLSEGGLPLALRVPLGVTPDIHVEWDATFGRMVLTGPSGISIFITADTLSLQTRKREIENGIFKITYLLQTKHLLYYKSTLPDGASPYWHYFASFEIGGKNYVFENNPLIEFTEEEVKRMTEITQNIYPQQNSDSIIYGKAN